MLEQTEVIHHGRSYRIVDFRTTQPGDCYLHGTRFQIANSVSTLRWPILIPAGGTVVPNALALGDDHHSTRGILKSVVTPGEVEVGGMDLIDAFDRYEGREVIVAFIGKGDD